MAIDVQGAYGTALAVGVPGMPASMEGWDADTGIVETVAGIGFGLAVSKGTADRGIVIGGTAFRGITYKDITLLPGATADIYPRYYNAGVMRRGDIWVTAVDAVTPADAPQWVNATGAIQKATGAGISAIVGGRFLTTAGAGTPVLLRLTGQI